MSDHLDMSELLELFLAEAGEQLQSIDEGLLALEQNPEDLNIVNNIFRAAHTLKGSSATMGFEQIASLTHSMENLFDKFRGGLLPVTAEAIDALLAAVDLLRALVRQALGGDATVIVIDEVLSDLKIVLDGGAGVPAESSSAAIESPVTSPDDCMRIEIRFSTDCDMPQGRAFMVFSFLDGKGEIVRSEPAQDQTDQLKPGGLLTLDFKPCVSKAEILESLDLICEISVTIHDPSNQSSEASISVSLDDVAALLMQIEAGNLDELARVAQSLRDFVADGSHSSSSRELVSQAVANLEESLAQGQGATDELLSKVGDLLGAAMDEMD
ncbi:MAG: Hpt domain-containing protein, partial [Armatimonadota bacterium]